jgi:hypothetical protein
MQSRQVLPALPCVERRASARSLPIEEMNRAVRRLNEDVLGIEIGMIEAG